MLSCLNINDTDNDFPDIKDKDTPFGDVFDEMPKEIGNSRTIGVYPYFVGSIYFLEEDTKKLPSIESLSEDGLLGTYSMDVPVMLYGMGFPGVSDIYEWFCIKYEADLWVKDEGTYKFRIKSDDGAILTIDGDDVVDNDGLHPPAVADGEVYLTEGVHNFVIRYMQGPRYHINLQTYVMFPDDDAYRIFSAKDFQPDSLLNNTVESSPFNNDTQEGFYGELFFFDYDETDVPDFNVHENTGEVYLENFNINEDNFYSGFKEISTVTDYFGIRYTGRFYVEEGGVYSFNLTSIDASYLYIDGHTVIQNGGIHPQRTVSGVINLERGYHNLQLDYFKSSGNEVVLILEVKDPISEIFSIFDINNFKSNVPDDVVSDDFYEVGTGFDFSTTRDIDIQLEVKDVNDIPIPDVNVKIKENDETTNTLIVTKTDENGIINDTFPIKNSVKRVMLSLAKGGTYERNILVNSEILKTLNRSMYMEDLDPEAPVEDYTDTDGDGIIDRDDEFPDDNTLAITVSSPNEGFYTLAYEDLFPSAGDTDFNDFVTKFYITEYLNASAEIVKIEGHFDFVARGAGYKHQFHVAVPSISGGVATLKTYGFDGVLENEETFTFTSQLDLNLIPNTHTDIESQNVNIGENGRGKSYDFVLVFNTPEARSNIGIPPYDPYIYVENTGYDIHLPWNNPILDSNNPSGMEDFMDSNGMPWALLLAGDWSHPLEKESIYDAYPAFDEWANSYGSLNRDWYTMPDSDYVYIREEN